MHCTVMMSAAADDSNDDDDDDQQQKKMMWAFTIPSAGSTSGKVMQVPQPTVVKPGWGLIRVLRAGVCNTDLEILQGYMGFSGVLGHEFVGVVEQVCGADDDRSNDDDDDHSKNWIGQRVCGDINVGCGNCSVCLNEKNWDDACGCPNMSRNHCPNRTVLGILNHAGTMAEYLTLPLRNLHVVPDDMPDEIAVFAEPLAAACRIVEQKDILRGAEKVAILGDGKLGLMIAEVLGRQESSLNKNHQKPVLFGKHEHKLQLVAGTVDTQLVSTCYQDNDNNNNNNNNDKIKPEYASQYDVVVDATGSPDGLALAVNLCRPMGTVVLKSTCAASATFHAAPVVIDELRVVGSRCGPIDKALELLQDESLNVPKYITKTFPLAQAAEAIQCAAEKTTMKVQIICTSN